MTKLATLRSYLTLGSKHGGIPELDGLRAVAIIMVLLHHVDFIYRDLHRSYHRQALPAWADNLMINGWVGVDLFFVLSGFLIFRHLWKTNPPNNNLSCSFGKGCCGPFRCTGPSSC